MIALPDLVPWWVAALTGAVGVCGGVAIMALLAGESYDNGKAEGVHQERERWTDLMGLDPLDAEDRR